MEYVCMSDNLEDIYSSTEFREVGPLLTTRLTVMMTANSTTF